jgi:glycosyltransferase involved in cell wall biosynthesis
MMRILHVVPSYYPALRYGGPIRSVHGLAKGLVRRGHEVHVFTTDVDGPGRSPVPLNEAVDMDGVMVWYFPTGFGRRLYRSPMMGRALDQRIEEFDIAHLHSVFLWPTSAAAAAARRARLPYIVAPRGMLVRDLIRRKSRLAKTAWINLLEKRNLECAAAIHVTSEIEANDLAVLGLRHKGTFTIPNGVEMPCAAGSSRIAHGLLAEHSSAPFVLFLGRINWKKGLDRLIPAMADVRGATLVIAGNDEEAYRPLLQALAERAGVAARTRFIGPLYGPDKWQVLAQATMLVLPSYSENFGIVGLEAMMAGCPVIVTPQVGLASVVRAVGAGLVVDGEPAELSRAINSLLQAPEQRRKMGEAGRHTAREKFSWDVIAADMEQVYRECVREGRRCSARSLQ